MRDEDRLGLVRLSVMIAVGRGRADERTEDMQFLLNYIDKLEAQLEGLRIITAGFSGKTGCEDPGPGRTG